MWNNYIVRNIRFLHCNIWRDKERLGSDALQPEEERSSAIFCLPMEFSEVTLMNSKAENIQTKTQLSSIREQARNASWRGAGGRGACQTHSNGTMAPIVCLMMNLH